MRGVGGTGGQALSHHPFTNPEIAAPAISHRYRWATTFGRSPRPALAALRPHFDRNKKQ